MNRQDTSKQKNDNRNRRRWIGEITLFALCLLILLGLAGFLVYQGVTDHDPAIPVEVTVVQPIPLPQETNGMKAIVPVEIRNRGGRTIQDLTIRIQRGDDEPFELLIDYLEEKALHTFNVYVRQPEEQVTAEPLSYTEG